MEVWKEQSLKIAQNNIWKTFFSWYIKASTIPRIHDDTCRIPLRIFSGDSSKLAKYIGGEVWPHSELSKPADLSDLWSLRHVSRNSRSSSTGPGPSKPKKRGTETFYQKNRSSERFQIFFSDSDFRDSFPFAFQEVSYALFFGGGKNPSIFTIHPGRWTACSPTAITHFVQGKNIWTIHLHQELCSSR